MDDPRFKKLTQLFKYIALINLQCVYKIDFSYSFEHIVIILYNDNTNYEKSITNLHKLSDEVLVETIDEILNDLDKYRFRH